MLKIKLKNYLRGGGGRLRLAHSAQPTNAAGRGPLRGMEITKVELRIFPIQLLEPQLLPPSPYVPRRLLPGAAAGNPSQCGMWASEVPTHEVFLWKLKWWQYVENTKGQAPSPLVPQLEAQKQSNHNPLWIMVLWTTVDNGAVDNGAVDNCGQQCWFLTDLKNSVLSLDSVGHEAQSVCV